MFVKTLHTRRLHLRPPRLEDAESAFERYASDSVATHFLLWKTHTTVDETAAFLSERMKSTAESGGGRWAICLQGDESMWGSIAASVEGHAAEVGYMLSPQIWGNGIMTEALGAVVSELWNHRRIRRIQASCHTDNLASERVLIKCGFERERLARSLSVMPQISGVPQDCYIYAMARKEPIDGRCNPLRFPF